MNAMFEALETIAEKTEKLERAQKDVSFWKKSFQHTSTGLAKSEIKCSIQQNEIEAMKELLIETGLFCEKNLDQIIEAKMDEIESKRDRWGRD